MKRERKLSVAWAVLYILCAVFGFIPARTDFQLVLEIGLAIGFFVPPAMLLYDAAAKEDSRWIHRIFVLSIVSLALSLLFLVLNFLSIYFSRGLGNAVYYILNLVSVPMLCFQFWLVSLFGWACLMMVCRQELQKIKAKETAARLEAKKKARRKKRK